MFGSCNALPVCKSKAWWGRHRAPLTCGWSAAANLWFPELSATSLTLRPATHELQLRISVTASRKQPALSLPGVAISRRPIWYAGVKTAAPVYRSLTSAVVGAFQLPVPPPRYPIAHLHKHIRPPLYAWHSGQKQEWVQHEITLPTHRGLYDELLTAWTASWVFSGSAQG